MEKKNLDVEKSYKWIWMNYWYKCIINKNNQEFPFFSLTFTYLFKVIAFLEKFSLVVYDLFIAYYFSHYKWLYLALESFLLSNFFWQFFRLDSVILLEYLVMVVFESN